MAFDTFSTVMSTISFLICLGLTTQIAIANQTAASPHEIRLASVDGPNLKSLPDELRKRSQALEVEVGKLENQLKGAVFEVKKAKHLSHWKSRFRVSDESLENIGLDAWVSALTHEPALGEMADSVLLLQAFDADKDPMRRHSGQPGEMAGSHNPTPILDRDPAMIMLWGPYAALKPGRYVAVYRVQFLEVEDENAHLQADANDAGGFFDACTKAVTFSGRRPTARSLPAGSWHCVGVPITVADDREFEFRFWPHGRGVAVDRIYLYKLNAIPTQPHVSIMGAVNCPGTYSHAKCNTLEALLQACGGGNHMANSTVAILSTHGKTEQLALDEATKNRPLQPGDVVEIPEK
jgi:hypothetical protein